jgi:hypothetical protein
MNETIIEILIDNSGSMGYMKGSKEEGKFLIDGQSRMSLIKPLLLTEIIPTIDYSSKLFIRTFRIAIEKEGNNNIETPTIYEGVFDKQKIEEVINKLEDPPLGGTPITAAINIALKNLENFPKNDRKIILLTDGEENGGDDYMKAVKKAEQLIGIPCKIFIIGLAQDEQSEKKTREIATGGYYNIKSKSFTANEIKEVLAPLKTAVLQNTIQNIETTTKNIQQQQQTLSPEIIKSVEQKIETLKKEKKMILNCDLINWKTKSENKLIIVKTYMPKLILLKNFIVLILSMEI